MTRSHDHSPPQAPRHRHRHRPLATLAAALCVTAAQAGGPTGDRRPVLRDLPAIKGRPAGGVKGGPARISPRNPVMFRTAGGPPARRAPQNPACPDFTAEVPLDKTGSSGSKYPSFVSRAAVLLDRVVIVGSRNEGKVGLYKLDGPQSARPARLPDTTQPLESTSKMWRVRVAGRDYLANGSLQIHEYRDGALARRNDLGPGIPIYASDIARVPEASELLVALWGRDAYFVDLQRRHALRKVALDLEPGTSTRAATIVGDYLLVAVRTKTAGRVDLYRMRRTPEGLPIERPTKVSSLDFEGWAYHLEAAGGAAFLGLENDKSSGVYRVTLPDQGAPALTRLHPGDVRSMTADGDRLFAGGAVFRWTGTQLELITKVKAPHTVDGFPYFPDLRGDLLVASTSHGRLTRTATSARVHCLKGATAVQEW